MSEQADESALDESAFLDFEDDFTDEELMAEVREAAEKQAPRLFALYEEFSDERGVQVRYWGLDFGDRAEVVGVTSRSMHGSFQSAYSAQRIASYAHPVELVWV